MTAFSFLVNCPFKYSNLEQVIHCNCCGKMFPALIVRQYLQEYCRIKNREFILARRSENHTEHMQFG